MIGGGGGTAVTLGIAGIGVGMMIGAAGAGTVMAGGGVTVTVGAVRICAQASDANTHETSRTNSRSADM